MVDQNDENGDISDFPPEVFTFFNTRGKGPVVTPSSLKALTGSTTLDLHKYDIYTMGKKKTSSKTSRNPPTYFTKLRICGKNSERNSLQGLLGIKFLSGYGHKLVGNSELKIMRPINIDALVTKDTSPFRKRSAVYINGKVLSLTGVEGLSYIPILDDRVMSMHETKHQAYKREAYARLKKGNNEWAHINRDTMLKENKRVLLDILVKYKKNIQGSLFFQEFMQDLMRIGFELGGEFGATLTSEDLMKDICAKSNKSNKRKNDSTEAAEADEEVKKRRVLDTISKQLNTTALRRVSSVEL